MKINIINNSINELPTYANLGDAGMDLRADFSKGINEDFLYGATFREKVIIIPPLCRALIPTNLHTSIPEGYELQVRPRSGLALKSGILIANSPGCVDSGYRNSIGIILLNLSNKDFIIEQGDRIAQAILKKFETIEWCKVESLDKSDRGLTGFGDSGIK
jgi:dUTP pyrophosphatase